MSNLTKRRRILLSPYIAFADVFLNLSLIFLLFIPIILIIGNRGWDNLRYKYYQNQMKCAVRDGDRDPPLYAPANDAPGEQRWRFASLTFQEAQDVDQSGVLRQELTPDRDSQQRLSEFADILIRHHDLWHRIRIEAHVPEPCQVPSPAQEQQSLELSAQRAVAVHEYLFQQCHIQPYEITSSGRGYHDPIPDTAATANQNDRVDILVTSPAVVTHS